ncbi:MAG: M23 family metallopeptidase, partial [Bacteroidetes bacterium]|nr:M23 family metallopeptidase [Bacteroidota bacterium]
MIKPIRNFYLLFLFVLGLIPTVHFAQTNADWTPPLDIPILLSGTFGEIRNNHFHAGLDIKTQGRQGLAVQSVKNGWINRIRISTGGYGKALYIQHYDGTTSVYAHLKKFAPKIEAYVKKKQYEKESYSIQLFPKSEELSIERGELIGYSGNTGESFGPHLHFEVRNSSTQNPINAMQYPVEIVDTQRPQIQNLFLYDGIHPDSNKKEFALVRKNDSIYTTAGVITEGSVNVGLRLFDRQDLSYNKNEIYKAKIRLNGVLQYEIEMNEISFNDSKYINLLIDYKEWAQNKNRIQRFIKHPMQKMTFLEQAMPDGQMQIVSGKSYQILIEVSDYHNNTSYIEAYLTGTNSTSKPPVKSYNISPDQDYLYDFGDKSVYFPKRSFFDSVSISVINESKILSVGENIYPLQKAYEVRFKVLEEDSLIQKQSFIATVNSKNQTSFFSAAQKDGYWTGKSNVLAAYTLSRDSVPPEIKPLNFKNKQWLS